MLTRLRSYRLAAVGAVLLALILSTGGWVFTQAAGRGETLQILAYDNLVRFVVQDQQASILRAEIFNLGGRRIFDSGPTLGSVLDWRMTTRRNVFGIMDSFEQP